MAMSETPTGRPYWPIALALVVGVAALVTAGVMLSSRFRTPVGVQPAPSISIAASPVAQAQGTTLVAAQQGSSPATSAASAPAAQQQIEAAYLRYWQVYSDAVLNLDPSHLNEVLAGKVLQLVTDEINGLKAQGKPAKIDVQHSYAIVRVEQSSATVVDDYVSRSVFVDPATKQPLARADPPTRVRQSFEFQKTDNDWKIVDGTRQALPS